MKKRFGFSLMEMMVVMLIISIIAAASAPMVNKKMLQSVADKSPWVWTSGQNIAYNMGPDSRIASIGASSASNDVSTRLYLKSNGNNPHISFGTNAGSISLFASQSKIALTTKDTSSNTNLLAVGPESNASSNSVSVGIGTDTSDNAVAYGIASKAESANSLAIGHSAKASNESAIAYGRSATAAGSNSLAVGQSVSALANDSIAIGICHARNLEIKNRECTL